MWTCSTTCARDPRTWRNEYSEGADRIRRFWSALRGKPGARLVRRSAIFPRGCPGMPQGREDEHEWVRRLGPTSPALIEYPERQHRSYDALVFFSLYHPTTVFGLAVAPERSVLFPCLRLDRRFGSESGRICSVRCQGDRLSVGSRTPLRRNVSFRLPTPDEVVGLGIEAPAQQSYPRHQQDPADDMCGRRTARRGVTTRRTPPTTCRSRCSVSTSPPPLRLVRCSTRGAYSRQRLRGMLDYFDSYARPTGVPRSVLMGAKLMNVPEQPYLAWGVCFPSVERMIA